MPIEIERLPAQQLEGLCILCDKPQEGWKTHARYVLTPEGAEEGDKATGVVEEIIFCPYHEFLLMEKMINNWEKRLRRGSKNPKAIPPRKENEDEAASGADAGNS